MSGTLLASKVNIRRLMRDFPVGSTTPAVPDETLIATINSWLLQLNAIFSLPDTWVSSAVSLVAGTRTYQLASTDYQTLAILRRSTDGVVLYKHNEDYIQQCYQNNPAKSGNPSDFALYEGTDEKLNIDLYPTPDGAAVAKNATLDAFLSTTVAALTKDTDTIAFPPTAIAALELLVAGECVMGFDQKTLEQKRLAPTMGMVLSKRGQMMLDTEKERRTQFQRTDEIRRVRF